MQYTKFSLSCFILLFGIIQPAAQPAVRISKIEPPNWWAGMQWSEVQLMVYGEQLDGITASFTDERIRVRAVHTLASPHYAFIDISIPADLPAGEYTLTLSRNGTETTATFPILARDTTPGRHQGFDSRDVVYLITPDRFANGNIANDRQELGDFDPTDPNKRHGGDLQGIMDHLDFLSDLGVTALWLNPVLENNGPVSYHGYAATDLYRIDPRFGANADYRKLVEEAHKRGLKVIFDHVNNHIGINHAWLSDLPAADWINGTPTQHKNEKHYLLS
ncbi:MAG: cyclomaltodextrinase N-terminal domain-containing protein, partial [Sinomicrobium sp.]|nr:cyclomaltodextrinase N-terminal domain-containing protein [Sinomicrobium sp.]